MAMEKIKNNICTVTRVAIGFHASYHHVKIDEQNKNILLKINYWKYITENKILQTHYWKYIHLQSHTSSIVLGSWLKH